MRLPPPRPVCGIRVWCAVGSSGLCSVSGGSQELGVRAHLSPSFTDLLLELGTLGRAFALQGSLAQSRGQAP